MGGFLGFGDYIFAYVYPISFLGAMFYGIGSIMYTNPNTIIANPNVAVALNIFIGLCGLLAIFNWFNNTTVPLLGDIILPKPAVTIKTQNY